MVSLVRSFLGLGSNEGEPFRRIESALLKTGDEVRRDAVSVAGGAVELALPSFARDVALRMERE